MSSNNNSNSAIYHTRLVGEVSDKAVMEVMRDIDTAGGRKEVKKICLTLSTAGGFLYPAFALYDHIKRSNKPIDIVAEGYCMSTGVMLLQAGQKRLSTPNTIFMVHPSNMSQEDKKPYSEFLSIVEQYKHNHDLFVKLTVQRTKLSVHEFEKFYQPRKYLTPEQALQIGLIDEVLEC